LSSFVLLNLHSPEAGIDTLDIGFFLFARSGSVMECAELAILAALSASAASSPWARTTTVFGSLSCFADPRPAQARPSARAASLIPGRGRFASDI